MNRIGAVIIAVALLIGMTGRSIVDAQPAPARVGWLTTGPHPFLREFRQALRELGYVEGQNLVIDERYTGDRQERLHELATGLARDKADVLVVSGALATRVARDAAPALPIVSVSGDPVGAGVVASLARPGGNVTGLSIVSADLAQKWMELVREALPRVRLVAILQDPAGTAGQAAAAEVAARKLGLRTTVTRAQTPTQIEDFYRAAVRGKAGAAVLLSSAFFASERARIVALAAQHRLPTLYEHRGFVDAGGLMSYGPDLADVFRRAATYVDRILKGGKPAEMPIEEPSKFQLVVNHKAATMLGLALPPAFLARADEVLR